MEGTKKLQVIQMYGLRPSTGTPFLDLDESISKQRPQTKAHIQERKRASTPIVKVLRMIEIMYLIQDFHVRFQKRNQGKQRYFSCIAFHHQLSVA